MTYGTQFGATSSYCVYFGCLFLATFFAYLGDKHAQGNNVNGYKVNKYFWTLSFLVLFLPVGLRGYGVDYENYVSAYFTIKSYGLNYFQHYNFMPEPLYALLNYLVANSLKNVQFVFIFSALIPLLLIYIHFSRYVKKTNLAMCIWTFGFSYYFFMYGLVRISIAVGIITYAYKYIERKKVLKYLVSAIFASLFHYSALIMIPMYFLVTFNFHKERIRPSKLSLFRYSLLTILATVALFKSIMIFFPILLQGFNWYGRYTIYFDFDQNWKIINNNAFIFPLLVIIGFWRKQICIYVFQGNLYIKFLIIMSVLSVSSILFPVHRVTYYFIPAACYVYSSVMKLPFARYGKNEISRIYNFMMFVMGILWIFISIFHSILWRPFLIPYYFNWPF